MEELGGDLRVAISVIPGRGSTHRIGFGPILSLFRSPHSHPEGGVIFLVVGFYLGLLGRRRDVPPRRWSLDI